MSVHGVEIGDSAGIGEQVRWYQQQAEKLRAESRQEGEEDA